MKSNDHAISRIGAQTCPSPPFSGFSAFSGRHVYEIVILCPAKTNKTSGVFDAKNTPILF
jgi:hypothetical protein